jgi:predicted enzyme related to lactoylglutathione lyase
VGPPDVQVGRMSLLADPQGATFALWQPGLHVGAQLVNEVGAMVWNQLATPDVDAAKAFYGELFDWTSEDFEDGYWSWRNREGWLNGGVLALPTDEVPPHWQVTFRVEDIRAATARAGQLGGEVLQPPMTTPVGDVAVVEDPAGAAFGYFEGESDP